MIKKTKIGITITNILIYISLFGNGFAQTKHITKIPQNAKIESSKINDSKVKTEDQNNQNEKQFQQDIHSKDSLMWRKRKMISWNDSTGNIINGLIFTCEIYCTYGDAKNKTKLCSPARVVTHFEYDRKNSFVEDAAKNALAFLYSQTIINIYQLYTRRLRKTCYEIQFKPGYYGLFENAYSEGFNQLQERDNNFRTETEYGKNKNKLEGWANQIKMELDVLDKLK